MSTLQKIFAAFLSLFGVPTSAQEARSYTAKEIKALVYNSPPNAMSPELVFTQFALEIGIESWEWKPGRTFCRTRNLSSRHVGSGRGYWTGDVVVAGADGTERLRVYESINQSLQDYGQLMRDPLYAGALLNGKAGRRADFFKALETAGYAGPGYASKLEARWKLLKARGVI